MLQEESLEKMQKDLWKMLKKQSDQDISFAFHAILYLQRNVRIDYYFLVKSHHNFCVFV